MLAFFGLGLQEIVLLVVLGVLVVGVSLAIVLMVVRKSGASTQREAALEDENRRLRAELDRDGRSRP